VIAAGSTAADGELEEGTVYDVLRNDRRRLLIEVLREEGDTASVRDLAETVAARESGTAPEPASTAKRQSVYVSFHQTHLPKLDSLGIVEYDSAAGDVRLLDRVEQVEGYMRGASNGSVPWTVFYFGWGLLGLLFSVGTILDAPILAAIGVGTVAVVFSLGLAVASAYHVYRQRDRQPFR
jgi:hypothetical protein